MPRVDGPPETDAVTVAMVRDALARQAMGAPWGAGGHARDAERGVAAHLQSRYPRLGHMILAACEWHRTGILRGLTGGSDRFRVPPAAGAVITGAHLPAPGVPLHALAAAAAPGARFAYTAPCAGLADILAQEIAGPRVSVVMAGDTDPDAVMSAGPVKEVTASGPAAVHVVLAPARWAPDLAPKVIARYAELLPPGSTLSLSLVTGIPGRAAEVMMDEASLAGGRAYVHTAADVTGWLTAAGLVLHPDAGRPVRTWRRGNWAWRYPVAPGVPGRVTVAAAVKPGG